MSTNNQLDSFQKSLLILLLLIFASIVFCLVALITLQEKEQKGSNETNTVAVVNDTITRNV